MAYGENETLGIYAHIPDEGECSLGEIRNRLVYDSRIPVHSQVWVVWIGRTRVECDSLHDAMNTAFKIAKRCGFPKGVGISALKDGVKRCNAKHLQPKSDYTVEQRLVLTVPAKHDIQTNESEYIAAECKVLEVEFRGSQGWWIRMGYEGGEFAAIESMDGQLEVQTPVGAKAAAPDCYGGLEGIIPPLYIAIRGVR